MLWKTESKREQAYCSRRTILDQNFGLNFLYLQCRKANGAPPRSRCLDEHRPRHAMYLLIMIAKVNCRQLLLLGRYDKFIDQTMRGRKTRFLTKEGDFIYLIAKHERPRRSVISERRGDPVIEEDEVDRGWGLWSDNGRADLTRIPFHNSRKISVSNGLHHSHTHIKCVSPAPRNAPVIHPTFWKPGSSQRLGHGMKPHYEYRGGGKALVTEKRILANYIGNGKQQSKHRQSRGQSELHCCNYRFNHCEGDM